MFAGLVASDFDAYAQNKWKSNVFNRERLEVKQRLVELARPFEATLTGSDGSALLLETSVEHPALSNHKQVDAQHVFFSRNQGARKELDLIINRGSSIASMIDDPTPQRNHIFLALTLTSDRLEIALRLHPEARVDRQNLERKIEDHFELEKLVHLLKQLPEEFGIGVTPSLESISSLTEESLKATVQSLPQPGGFSAPGAPHRLFSLARVIPRADALAKGAALAEDVRDTLARLVEIYRTLAWSRDNDFVSMKETLQKEKQTRRQKGLAKNDAVRIVRGMFAGKAGVIQEVDAKGGLKVLVGKMAVKVDAADVESK